MKSSKQALLLTALFLGTVAYPTLAAAQTAEAAASDSENGLGDIVVTAERRSENLTNVPVSVGVLSGDDTRAFTSGGDDTLLSLSGKVPSLYIESTTGRIFPRFYIRGLGNVDFYLGASQPVSIIQDDVVLEHVVLKSNPVYDVAQVEVLRGPQGSLFGRNTTAGIVKFDTNRPTMDFQGRASLSVGTYDTVNFDAGVGGPLIADKLAVRVSVLAQHRQDYVDNTFRGVSADGTVTPAKNVMGGFDDLNARLQLLYTPTSNLSVLLSGHVRDYNGTSTLFLRGALTKGSNQSNAPRDSVAFDEANNNPQAYKTQGASGHITWDLGGVEVTSITAYEHTSGYSRGDTDGGAAANFPVGGVPNGFGESQGQIRDLDQWTQEVRLASNNDGPLKWQVGGFYFDSRDITDFYQRAYFLTTAARNPNNWVRLHNVNTSWAGFGQASYTFNDRLTVTGGVRYTKDTKTTDLLKTADTAAGVVTYPGRRHVRLSDDKVSWDVSALYKVSDDASVYARVARGFRGPTIQGRSAVFNSDFTTANSETITSYEAGFKSQWLDNRLRFNASAFYWRVNDIQLNGNDTNGNGVLFNANRADAYGAEAELEFRPVPELVLSLGGSVLHTEIKDSKAEAQVCALNGAIVCTVLDPVRTQATPFGPVFLANINGNPLPNAPKYNLNFTARYDIPVTDSGKFFIATDWNVQGYTNFVLYETKEFTSKGNFEGGLKVGYSGGNGTWELAAFARNITNEKNLKGVIENYMAAVYNDPRIIGVSFSGKIR
ncbi:TonB-dependent receptor [Novosphingobium sp. G106]|uniref:TonB-dependent receptor n=1 Tax=Novosphingobium sp. G106 TaxID=2849500 RepID=UPI001C2D3835|nr:TonB-dependent receptor [Novosphingobium sp. G106]MBV1687508.1 TonB-dependent receptor [Novosphingobium sp. G106]